MKRLISAALLGGLLLATVPNAQALPPEDKGGLKTIHFTTVEDDIGFMTYPQSCGVNQAGFCSITSSGQTDWSGDFEGSSLYHQTGHFDAQSTSYRAESWDWFVSVTVAGCGTGNMIWEGVGVASAQEQDPTTGKVIGHGTWNYVPGSGTGDLANVVSGTMTFDHIEFAPGTWENHEKVTGTIVCRTDV
jgi:hypothetical protein